MIRSNLLPSLGAKKAEAIAKSDVIGTINTIMDRGACYQANRNLALVRTIFNWAIDHDLVETNPALRIPMPAEEIERARVMSESEIRRFFAMIGSAPMTRPLQIALEMALLTGARIGEILEARKSEFDLPMSLWTIPGRRPLPRAKKSEGGTKNKLDHVLPLGPLTTERIEETLMYSKDSEWLFPSPKSFGREPVGEKAASRAWRRVRGKFDLDDVHVHDFRRTMERLLQALATMISRLVSVSITRQSGAKSQASIIDFIFTREEAAGRRCGSLLCEFDARSSRTGKRDGVRERRSVKARR